VKQGEKMQKSLLLILAASLGTLAAQNIQRHASITRGGGPGNRQGCTVDVVVDGSVEVEIRGDNATMRNLGGAPPQFRQFDCTEPIPANIPGFQFNEVDGRGRQELIRTPRDGGPVVVRIDDPQAGQGEYRFELSWSGSQGGYYRPEQGDRGYDPNRDLDRDHMQYQQERERYFRGDVWRNNLFQRVREDVEHLQHSTFPFTGDQSRLSRTIFELNELQEKLSQGRYDGHELDDVMYALTSVLQNNRLSARDRDVLADDLGRMREYREHHEGWGRP
jgi:hypothetical protein